MNEIVAALIGGVIGFLGSFLVLRFNYKQLFAQTVSSNRMDWINKWRENLSIFLANAEVLHEMTRNHNGEIQACALNKSMKYVCECEKYIALKTEMLKSREMITSRLNLNEDLHRLMFATIKQIDIQSNDFFVQREYIEELARQILKPEWERLKREAKGKEN